MTLYELSFSYRESAALLRVRIRELGALRRQSDDSEERLRLQRRIADLTPLLREMRELATLTEQYYDRSYHKNEKYTL